MKIIPGLTEKETKELKILEDPNIQYSTPSSAFIMDPIYKWLRKRKINKLRSKIISDEKIN
ncbi:hypothetical protein KAJ89_04020 [Candidatus Parcubacteria bacterium]|nr:hypothetical protein [Candidatus Parcubacteria bacterium]